MNEEKWYEIDWTKIKSFDELIFVLSCLDIQFNSRVTNFEKLKKYLKVEE
jgi:hypothetical protein